MSFLGGNLDFELFNLKDMFKKAKDNPERLLIGAVDPFSTKMWNKILGKDYEPIVDQMGGPYGGHTISAFGKTDGGVFQRARDSGINTKPAEGMHDAAHVIAALYAGNYGLGKIPGLGGTSGGSGYGSNPNATSAQHNPAQQNPMQQFQQFQMPQQQEQPQNNDLGDELRRRAAQRSLEFRLRPLEDKIKAGVATEQDYAMYQMLRRG